MGRLHKIIGKWWTNNNIDPLPIAKILLRYDLEKFWGDCFAGLSVALLVFPQAIAYALLAGLPTEYGLYGATVATMIAALFSGVYYVNLGPTNSTAVLMLSTFAASGIPAAAAPELLPILLVLVGIFLLLSAFFNVASLAQYVSRSVILGYVTAIVVIMIVHQLHYALGFPLILAQDRSQTFFDVIYATLTGLKCIDIKAATLSILTILAFRTLKKYFPQGPFVALTILSLALLTWFIQTVTSWKIEVLTAVDVESWKASFSGFNFDNINLLADSAMALSFICLIDITTIVKTMAARIGVKPPVNQVVYSLGLANIFCGICSGMPASGSLVRSSASYISGAKTALVSFFCGIFCLLGIVCLGPLFHYIPRAGLATLIILLACQLFDKHAIRIVITATQSDCIVFFITCFSAFIFPLNTAIYLGVFLSIALFLKKAAAPEFHEYRYDENNRIQEIDEPSKTTVRHPEISIVHIEGNLFFASSEMFRQQIREVCERPLLRVIILKLRNAMHVDATCLLALEELFKYMQMRDSVLILSEVNSRVLKALKRSGILKLLGPKNIFLDQRNAPNVSTAKALKHAQEIIGHKNLNIRILTHHVAEPISYSQKIKTSIKSFVTPIQNRIAKTIKKK